MAPISNLLRAARRKHPELKHMHKACGKEPLREPPPSRVVEEVRRDIAEHLGLRPELTASRHPNSPWQAGLIREIQRRAADPDAAITRWLDEGAPMGIAAAIETSGGIFPEIPPEAVDSIDDLAALDRAEANHPSFRELHGEATSPAQEIVRGYVESGFARLFSNQAAAEQWLGAEAYPAPLGNVVRETATGRKHRVIQDLRTNGVNRTVRLPERQVLPRPLDHAVDIAALRAEAADHESSASFVIDVKDAFMTIPLAKCEMRYNCARLSEPIPLKREPDPEEAAAGDFIVWRVLGFGGRPNPLVFARVAAFAARSAQALFKTSRYDTLGCEGVGALRLQLYVDDPIAAVQGKKREITRALDMLMLWWLVIGMPLAWRKGTLSYHSHAWIGVLYAPCGAAGVTMTLPPEYLAELLELLAPFCAERGTRPLKDAIRLVGKAGRVAHIVPMANPFVHGLWGALSAAQKAGHQEAPPGQCCTRRFCQAAAWLRALVRGGSASLAPLERVVTARPTDTPPESTDTIEFDASPWGGGAARRTPAGYTEFWELTWTPAMVAKFDVQLGAPRSQTFFESLALLACLLIWADDFRGSTLRLVGDNTGSLQNALALRGRGPLLAIARELAWRKARFGWKFSVSHLPSEHNGVADALSRRSGPDPLPRPACLSTARRRDAPDLSLIWVASADQKL